MSDRDARAVVVAYHGAQEVDRALAPLAGAMRITVVDNSASLDVRRVACAHGAEYVATEQNVGFAAAVNIGLRESLPRSAPSDVLLLNPDAVLELGELGKLVAHLHRRGNERVAAVAPILIAPDGARERVSWPFPSPARAWAEAVGLGQLPASKNFVVGAVMLLRYEALRDVGPFDERYFLYAEEADWQRRAAARGWFSEVCREARAHHIGAATSRDPVAREAMFHAGQETYVRKWFGSRGWLSYRAATFTGALARAVVLRGERRAQAAARARLYLHGPRRSAMLLA